MKSHSLKIPRTTLTVKVKLRTCRNKACREKFTPDRPLQSACCIGCAIITGRDKIKADAAKAAKLDRAVTKQKLAALKPRSKWLAEAQTSFNAFIRARDVDQMCIDCGKPFEPQKIGGSVDAGHYLSRGSSCHLRFDERNTHAQRKNCNRPGGTTRDAFRAGMLARIGAEALAALESDQAPRCYTIDDLKALKATYQAKLKQLQKERE